MYRSHGFLRDLAEFFFCNEFMSCLCCCVTCLLIARVNFPASDCSITANVHNVLLSLYNLLVFVRINKSKKGETFSLQVPRHRPIFELYFLLNVSLSIRVFYNSSSGNLRNVFTAFAVTSGS